MKTRNLKWIAIFCIATMVAFVSCKKDKDESSDSDLKLTKLDSEAEYAFEQLDDMADEAYADLTTKSKSTDLLQGIFGPCATKTIDTVSIPHILTIDFGTTNCLCNDGRNRRGQIILSYTGHYNDSGSYKSFTFNNYFVNDNQILGTKTKINNGKNTAGNWTFSTVVNGQVIFVGNADTISWNANRNIEWIAGANTPTRFDNEYLITGSSSGTKLNNTSYTKQITTPLHKKVSCHNFVSGIVVVTPSNKPQRIIDYGNGACDNLAQITINGNTFTIVLH